MSRLIRRKTEIGATLAVALQLMTLTLIGVIGHFVAGPQQPTNRPAESQIVRDQTQTQNAQAPTGTDRSSLRASAVYANKVSGPRAAQVFNLATSRAQSAESTRQQAQRSMQEGETPNGASLTADQEDYPPYSYVYFHGTGFQPGETVNMIVVELDPTQQSFEPWDVVADENGEFYTSWYIFSTDFIGATLQATATGDSSQLTASATFTDASGNGIMTVSPTNVLPGTTNNSLTFQFRALNGAGNAYGAGSFATVVIPAGWTAPTTTSGQPGFVSASQVGTATVGSITVASNTPAPGASTITVPFTASGTSNGFNLTYGVGAGAAVTAPCATGAYTFTTSTSQNGSPVAQVGSNPIVFDGITATLAAASNGASAGNLGSVVSNTVTANAGQTLLILVTAEDDSGGNTRTATVANTSGANPLSGGSALPVTTNAGSSNSWVCSGNDCYFMYAFRATATGTSGTVTVTFPTAVKNAAVDVIALSGNNTSTPIGLTGINSGNNSTPNWNLTGSLTPGSSMLLFGDTTNFTATPPTWSATPPTLFSLVDSFTENDSARTHTLVNYFGGPSALSVSGSLSASARWGTIAIEILPATTPPTSCFPCTTPSVTIQPSPQTVTYGAASAIFSAAASGSPAPTVQWQVSTGGPFTDLANNATYSGVTTGTLTINNPTVSLSNSQYRAVFTNTCNGTNIVNSNSATLTVNPAPLTVTANNQSKTYGNTFTFTGTEFTTGAGQLKFGDTVTSVTLSSSGAPATAAVGSYAIVPSAAVFSVGSASNYNITYANGSLTVNAAPLDITATNGSKTYGDLFTPNGSTQFSTTPGQLKNGDQVVSVTLTSSGYAATAAVGSYAIVPSAAVFTPAGAASNYSITYHNGSFTVNAAPLTITANNQTKTYGTAFTFTGTEFTTGAGQLKNGDTVASVTLTSGATPATATVAGSPYTIVPSAAVFAPVGAATNYAISYANGSFTVTAATLDITANNQSKTYGATFTFTGSEFSVGAGQLKNGDTVASVTLTSSGAAATATVAGSPYSIVPSAAVFSPAGAASNYNVIYHNGSFAVNAAQLDVTANNQSKSYGTAFTFTGTEFTTGAGQLKNGDTVASVTLTSSGAAATATVAGSPYIITASAAVFTPAAANSNYTITYHNGSFTVNAAQLDVTANNQTKAYGTAFTFTGTEFTTGAGQLKNGDTVASVTLTSSGAAATATVGGSPYTITASAAVFAPAGAAGNYSVTYHNGSFTVNPAPLDITATNESKNYGDTFSANGATQFSTGPGQLKNGDQVASVTLNSAGYAPTADVAGSPYAITPSAATFTPAAASSNYAISYHDGQLTVNATPLDVTATNESKTYGDTFTPNGATQFSVGAGQLKNGDVVASVTLTSTGYGATATVAGSPYAITPSAAVFTPTGASSNYAISYHAGQLTVNGAPLDITATNESKTYGDTFTPNGATQFSTGSGQLKNGDLVASVTLTSAGYAATATVAGSPYTITASAAVFTPGSASSNYAITYHAGQLTVNAAPLDITASNESKTYGDTFTPNGTTQFSTGSGQLKNGDVVASVTLTSGGYAATATVAGSPYVINVSAAVFTPAVADTNYVITYHSGSLTVNPAPLDITATNESKTYGDTFTPNGATQFSTAPGQLKNGDAVASVTLTSAGYAATATVAGSPYVINVGAAVFTPAGADTNYVITYHSGELTVNAAALDITATNESKTYGDTFTPNGATQFTTGAGQLKNGDQVASVTLTSSGYVATATVAGSPYAINASAAVFTPAGANSNYVITYHSGQLTVNPAALDITATNESKTYGDTFTPNGATQFGVGAGQLKNGDVVASVTLTSSGYAATATVAGSPYAINVSAAVFTPAGANTNYVITYHSGQLTVNPAALDITATNESKTYGDTFTPNGATQFSVGAGQLKNGDVVASVTLISSGYAATATVAGSPYAINVSAAVFTPAGANSNYVITYHSGQLTVNPAALDITATNESKTYGDTFTPNGATQFSVGAGQLKNGDVVASVTLTSGGYAATATVAGSPYAINVSAAVFTPAAADTNYVITYHSGELTVNAAALDITATNESKTYGDTFTPNGATQFTTGAGQLKNGDQVASVTLTSSGYAATATVAGSPYAINASAAVFTPAGANTNYVITYHSGQLTVNPAALDITATNESKTYGDTFTPNGATQFSVGAGQLKNGDVVASVTLTSSGYAATATVAGSPDVINVSAAVFTPAGADINYVISYHSGQLIVNAAALDITATNESKTYGDTFTPNGATQFTTAPGQLKNGDAVASVTLTSTGYAATATVAGSPYVINVGAAVFTPAGADTNYVITYHSGELTVNAATLDITATNESKTYGDTFTPNGATQFTTGAGQLKNGDVVASVTLTSSGYVATATVAGSPYAINVSAAFFTPASADTNYVITYHSGQLTVNPAALDITATNESKTYGDTFTPNGATQFSTGAGQLKNGDVVASVTLTSSGYVGTATVAGSPYTITASAAVFTPMGADTNYAISYHTGHLTVNPATLNITANNQSKTYGDTFSFTGTEFSTGSGELKNGDTVASVSLSSAGTAATATVTAPGPDYTIAIGSAVFAPPGAGSNYSITYHTGTLHINPAALDITANNQSKTYGDTFSFAGTEFTTGVSQLKNGDTVSSVTLMSTGAAAAATVVAPGPTYAINASAAVFSPAGAGGNYSITYHSGTLTVTVRGLDITANNRSKTYGATMTLAGTEFTTGSGQLVNGNSVTSVTLSSAGAAATATVIAPGPTYTINISAAVFSPAGAGGNYSVTYHTGTLTVNPAALTITATNRSKVFGATYTPNTTTPPTDFTVTGLLNSDTVTSITLTCPGYTAAALPQPTPYVVAPSNATGSGLGNYTINYVNGQFTIGYNTCTGPNAGGVILQPINADGTSIFPHAGRTVPVKFTVCDASGNPISNPNAVFAGTGGPLTMLSAVRGQIPNPDENQYNDIPDAAFRYSDGIWIFNMATSNLQSGYSYGFRINLANGQGVTFTIAIK